MTDCSQCFAFVLMHFASLLYDLLEMNFVISLIELSI